MQLLTKTKTVIGDGKEIKVTPQNFSALLCLAKHRDDKENDGYVSNVNMRVEAWGSTLNSERVVDVAIFNIRQALGKDAVLNMIGKGSKLSKEIEIEIINSIEISIGKIIARTDIPYQHVSKKILFVMIVDVVSVGNKQMFLAVDKGTYVAIEPELIGNKWIPHEKKILQNYKKAWT